MSKKKRFFWLNSHHVSSLRPLGAVHHVELYFLSLAQCFKTLTLDHGIMDENVSATLLFNEAKTLLFIEPFHFAFFLHLDLFLPLSGILKDCQTFRTQSAT